MKGLGLAAGILALAVLLVSIQSPVRATGPAYQYESFYDDDGVTYVQIDILDQHHLETGEEDYSEYKAASDQRVDDWVALPGQAPPIDGIEVALTFEEPKTGSEAAQVLSGLLFQVERMVLVESLSTEQPAVSEAYGPLDAETIQYVDDIVAAGPQPSWICEQAPGHEGCFDVTTTGIMMLFGRFTANGLSGLQTLRNHADVYLADSTAIDYLDQNPASSASMVDLPWALWANATEVTWP